MTGKSKRLIVSLIVSLILYVGIKLICLRYEESQYASFYILQKEIYEGEAINKEDLLALKVENVDNNSINKSSKVDMGGIEEDKYISKYNLKSGQILTNDLIAKNIPENIENKEYISIKINSGEEALSYQLKSKDMVNIYYTSKICMVDSLLEGKEKIYSSNQKEGMVTYKLLENIEVIGIFSENGNEIKDTDSITKVFKTIVFRVDKETAMLISNIKGIGEFNLTKIK